MTLGVRARRAEALAMRDLKTGMLMIVGVVVTRGFGLMCGILRRALDGLVG